VFCRWLFGLLGAAPGDQLDDLFPGSGAVTRAWAVFADVKPSRLDPHDASGSAAAGRAPHIHQASFALLRGA
jgi:hypothetical protein